MVYKSCKEWGIPEFPGDDECYICGHSCINGHQKFVGFQEIDPDPNDKTIFARMHPICSICAQVQLVANKESLHDEKDTPNCWKPIKRIFLVKLDRIHISAYEVLDKEPWLKMVQSSKDEPDVKLRLKNQKEGE